MLSLMSNANVLKDLSSAGNPGRGDFFLKLNLPDHRKLKDGVRLELVPLSLLVSGDVILSTMRSSTKHNLVSPSCDFVIL
ncbi:hypothetical protein Tco_0410803 [Tanacetum coccineum]